MARRQDIHSDTSTIVEVAAPERKDRAAGSCMAGIG